MKTTWLLPALIVAGFGGLLVREGKALADPVGTAKPDDRPSSVKPEEVLKGLRDFFRRTALADGSFRPGIDPAYEGMSDSAYSDLAPVAYAVVLHRTFGW